MPSTYTTRLRLTKQANGENSTTWGTIANEQTFDMIDEAFGLSSVTHDDTAAYTLSTANGSTDQARPMIVEVGGTLTAARQLVVPDAAKAYLVYNNTSGGFDITVKTAAGSGVTVSNGSKALVYSDGTNVVSGPTSGNVSGPGSSTDYGIALFNGTGGATLRDMGGVGNSGDVLISQGAGAVPQFSASTFLSQGTFDICVVANAMQSTVTNGATLSEAEMATNGNMLQYLEFDPTTQEYAQFGIAMPKGWDEGTVTYKAYWSHPSTATNFGVVWSLRAVAVGDSDPQDVTFGTAITVTDTGGTTNDMFISPASSALTAAGTPAASDFVMFQISRAVNNGSDTMAVDARLHSIVISIQYGANDA